MIFLSFNTRFVYKVEKQVENLAIIQQHTFCMPQGTSNYRVYARNSGLFTIKQLYKMNILYNSGQWQKGVQGRLALIMCYGMCFYYL